MARAVIVTADKTWGRQPPECQNLMTHIKEIISINSVRNCGRISGLSKQLVRPVTLVKVNTWFCHPVNQCHWPFLPPCYCSCSAVWLSATGWISACANSETPGAAMKRNNKPTMQVILWWSFTFCVINVVELGCLVLEYKVKGTSLAADP